MASLFTTLGREVLACSTYNEELVTDATRLIIDSRLYSKFDGSWDVRGRKMYEYNDQGQIVKVLRYNPTSWAVSPQPMPKRYR